MTINNIKTRRFLRCLNILAAISIMLLAFDRPAVAQSSDPDHPTPMTGAEVKGRWPGGNKAFAHYYSFTAGPGEVIVMFNFVSDKYSLNVGGQLMDAYGKAFTELNTTAEQNMEYQFVYGMAEESGIRLVGRFNVKRRQKLMIGAYSRAGSTPEFGGSYKIRVEGGDPSFNGDTPPANLGNSSNNPPANTNTGNGSLPCLPRSGRLRIEMEDGSVQEINLSRMRNASIKP